MSGGRSASRPRLPAVRAGGSSRSSPCFKPSATLLATTRRSHMTELATPPVEEKTGVTRISHWIDGRSVAGKSGRSGPVYNPATGSQTGAVDFASVDEVDQ